MGDWDDDDAEDNMGAFGAANDVSTVPAAAEADDFGGSARVTNSAFDDEDEDSDDGADAWDDSEEEPEPEAESGTPKVVKSKKEAQAEAKAAKEAWQKASLREARMKLARRAGRFEAQEKAKAALSMTGIIGEDGFERRTDPSDGNNYTFAEFEEAYGPQAAELWVTAVQMMADAKEQAEKNSAGGDLGAVQQDSDALFGDDGDFYGDGDGSDDDDVSASAKKTLEACFMHQLVGPEEYTDAQDVLVNKFEQLLVSGTCQPPPAMQPHINARGASTPTDTHGLRQTTSSASSQSSARSWSRIKS